MTKKLQSTTNKLAPILALAVILGIWYACAGFEVVPRLHAALPYGCVAGVCAQLLRDDVPGQGDQQEALYGLGIGVALAFILSALMDRFHFLYQAIYPILIITQTIPTIAIAPLLVLWMGFGMAPKITLVVITTFFPISIGLLDGYRSADPDEVNLLRAMGANRLQVFWHIKLPSATGSFFSGLRISASYAVVGAVISEWLGGFEGLGVYMTRVKKAYAFDKMFAVIVFISVISLLLMALVALAQRLAMPWANKGTTKGKE